MEDETLFKIALIFSMTGILLLFIISDSIEIKEFKIKELTKKEIEKTVKVKGTITRVTETPGLIIFNMRDNTGEITGIMFKEESINLTQGQKVEVKGKITEYKEKLEIQAEEIKTTNL